MIRVISRNRSQKPLVFGFQFFLLEHSLIKYLKTEEIIFSLRRAFSFLYSAFNDEFYYLNSIMPPKTKSFQNRLNFWSSSINQLINTPVDKRCYNLVGTKTEAIKSFITNVMLETNFDEVKVSTLIEAFKSIQLLSLNLAKLYEEKAETHYGATSPEHSSRVKYDFIRTDGESWKDIDEYNGVIIFPVVALNTKSIMTDTFKFSQKQISEMDKLNDVDGRVALAYQTRMTLLIIHLGFGEFANPNLTLQGKTSVAKSDKLSSAAEQRTKDLLEEESAGDFKNLVEEKGERKSDDLDEEAFDKDQLKKKELLKERLHKLSMLRALQL